MKKLLLTDGEKTASPVSDEAGRGEVARVFFALWPDEPCAARLYAIAERLAGRFGGRAMQQETLHLTLVFVGDVNVGRLPELLELASEAEEAFRSSAPALPDSGAISGGSGISGPLLLDRLGYWRHKRIFWMGCDHCPVAPGILAELLAGKLRARGYAIPLRPFVPFVPHVTLVRKVKLIPPASELEALNPAALAWPCGRFVLVRSRLSSLGAAYERLGSWKLACPD